MQSIRASNGFSHLRSALFVGLLACIPALSVAQQGAITGRVTAVDGVQPLPDSRVYVVGTNLIATTNADGRYTLRSAAGQFEVRVLRVGYSEQKKSVTVTADATAALDFSLAQAVIKLTEIVTTATGEQRRIELGHSVQTLGDIAQKVEQAPIKDLADLMVAKAPGVTVLPGSMTGAAPNIKIRGIKSLSLSSDPIFVIDGIRMNSSAVTMSSGGTQASMLSSLNPEDISDIEIVKGPSAATLYGTDAANGVVVITTKKGQAGSGKWMFYTDGGVVKDLNEYPTQHALFGHTPANPAGLARCILVTVASGACIPDSLTSYNLLADPEVSPKTTGRRGQFGGQVSGGSETVRYFVSGEVEAERGPLEMPKFFQTFFDTIGTAIREEWLHPETFKRSSLRMNLNMVLTPRFDLAINSGYTKTDQRLPQVDNNINSYIFQAFNNPGFKPTLSCRTTPANCLGYTNRGSLGEVLGGYTQYTPGQMFQNFNNHDVDRFINSANAQWRPISWMQNSGTVGVDYAQRDRFQICRFQECADFGTNRQGFINNTRTSDRNLSLKLNSTSTWHPRAILSVQTTIGADYVNQQSEFALAGGSQLPPGAQSSGQSAVQNSSNSLPIASKTLGYYLQEQAAIRDRLFLTLAVRTDQNSAFGTQFQRVIYPKASVSYLLSDEPFFPKLSFLNSLRLRSAYGASGVQPGATTSLQTFGSASVSIAPTPAATTGADTPGLLAAGLGNPDLRPERSTEREFGFEVKLLGNRVNLDATYYNNLTKDALISQPIAASSGASSLTVLRNLGSLRNSGIEATLTMAIVDTRKFGWDMTIGGSHNTNKIESLGLKADGTPNPTIGTGALRDSAGYPSNGVYSRTYTFADANSNGIIEASEVKVDPNFSFLGYSTPRDLLTVQNGFDLFQRRLRLNFSFDYKGGFSLLNQTGQFYCQQTLTCFDETSKDAALEYQARNIAQRYTSPTTTYGYWENGQFWRFRELGATLTMPHAVNNALRARDASLSLTARNLKVWTAYTGTDPEANYSTLNVQTDFSTTSPPSYFTLRLNLHY